MYRHGPLCREGPVPKTHRWGATSGCHNLPADPACLGQFSTKPIHDRAMRLDLVARVRREIAAGTYETPEKWDLALECLFERLDLD
jgi:hypothetical protein